MSKPKNGQYSLTALSTQATPPLAPGYGHTTRELEHIARQTEEMIARIAGIASVTSFGQQSLEYVHEVAVNEIFEAVRHDSAIVLAAQGEVFAEQLLSYVHHSLQRLQQNSLALENGAAYRIYEEIQRKYTPAKKGLLSW